MHAENSRNTDAIDEDPRLKQQHVIRLHDTLYQPTGLRLLPTVNRDAERILPRQTWDESRENRDLPIAGLGAEVGRRAQDGRILEVRRSSIFGDVALRLEFVQRDPGALREEENVPVLVAHGVLCV